MKIPFILAICALQCFQHRVSCFLVPVSSTYGHYHNWRLIDESNSKSSITTTTPVTSPGTTTALYESKKKKGVYARPSAAIEQGSGFYVPGLEGSKVRILFGVICLVLTYINSLFGLGDSNPDAVAFSENLVVFYGVLLLFQGIIEYGKEIGLGLDFFAEGDKRKMEKDSTESASAKELDQMISVDLKADEKMVDKVKWAAASFVSLTPATSIQLLDENDGGRVLYSLGNLSEGKVEADPDAIRSAIETVHKSKGGRVSIPDSHPCAVLLPEEKRRCILLQKVVSDGKKQCLMVGSNQLLAAFTKNDLKWLGSLGAYLDLD